MIESNRWTMYYYRAAVRAVPWSGPASNNNSEHHYYDGAASYRIDLRWLCSRNALDRKRTIMTW